MKKIALLTPFLALSALNSAHAGVVSYLSESINDAFTFREDQKERVAPRKHLPPKVVQTPNFNTQENTQWARTYTRPDLVPVDHLAGSASKVMRPSGAVYGANALPGGGRLSMLENRDRINRAQNTSNRIYIGDAGTGPGMNLYDANVGKKTTIGDPRNSWQDGQRGDYAQARPGDYNYHQIPDQARGNVIDYSSPEYANRQHNPPNHGRQVGNIHFHDDGVSNYVIQRGDTLTNISEKPNVYGNWKLWPLIQKANKATIGNNPNLIYPDRNLNIPRGLPDEEIRDAVRNSTNW